ncbi:MAG: glycosyltransferase family 2 protein [Phreatobacter sp.]|uniref:glycosyltransferase family 2 protein n=1 Tax=Phreatobacter sp. TaxID=1966341 RepID=UPI0027323305|nr:glycosyltransferase family 2 protein [Phreatobacter sp.]MDP2802121.1 glycosyltransferase family 2 protein [Phreatobacter sp.]
MSLAGSRIGVVIPTRNEAKALPAVLGAMPVFVDTVVIGDYLSTDGTQDVGRRLGAIVVNVEGPGYGRACLAAIAALPPVDVIVFVDGDAADDLSAMTHLVQPIIDGEADLVLGSRVLGQREAGALTPQQVFGNWLACSLMRLVWGRSFTDLGPFRAISHAALQRLAMADLNYGWTVEMQIKAARVGLRTREIPVDYRRRIGVSKVSGTVSGTIKAGTKILWVIGREALRPTRREPL